MGIKGTIVASAVVVGLAAPAARADGPEQAKAEIRCAEHAVETAREQRALWTTAVEALAQAQAALERGDYATAVRAARVAQEQVQLGIAQTRAPRFP